MFKKLIFSYVIIILILCIFFVSILSVQDIQTNLNNSLSFYSDIFSWPIPGYTYISSYFGRRTSPTAGASSNHLGVDIPAPEGTYLHAIDDGYISFASWGARWWLYYSFRFI